MEKGITYVGMDAQQGSDQRGGAAAGGGAAASSGDFGRNEKAAVGGW